jgi:hypothetical protein
MAQEILEEAKRKVESDYALYQKDIVDRAGKITFVKGSSPIMQTLENLGNEYSIMKEMRTQVQDALVKLSFSMEANRTLLEKLVKTNKNVFNLLLQEKYYKELQEKNDKARYCTLCDKMLEMDITCPDFTLNDRDEVHKMEIRGVQFTNTVYHIFDREINALKINEFDKTKSLVLQVLDRYADAYNALDYVLKRSFMAATPISSWSTTIYHAETICDNPEEITNYMISEKATHSIHYAYRTNVEALIQNVINQDL